MNTETMQQVNLVFDGQRSEQLKIEGMTSAAEHRANALTLAREIAIEIALARPSRTCTADLVGRELQRRYGIKDLGPAAGSLFKTADWKTFGEFVKSKRVTNHSRLLRVWVYVGADKDT